jgi:DNA-binding NarL/FixJ family response regulator
MGDCTTTKQSKANPLAKLSKRQFAVAQLAAQGLSDAQIAAELKIPHRTVSDNISNALKKLGCRSRKDLKTFFLE